MILVRGQQLQNASTNGRGFKYPSLYDVGTEFGRVVVAIDHRDQDAREVLFGRCALIFDHNGQLVSGYAFSVKVKSNKVNPQIDTVHAR